MLSLELSPVFSRLERAVTRDMARMFGLGEHSGGIMQSGGSLANLQALALARNVRFKPMAQGLVGLRKPPVLFASQAAHTSIQKAAMLLGLGTQAVVQIPTDAQSRMDTQALTQAITQAKAQGQEPFAVVATAGTTVTGSIDPLPQVAAIARQHGLWFHVDAAYGGALMLSEKARGLLTGIERADSVTFNPQKWLYVTKVCAMLLLREEAHLERYFRTDLPYMQNSEDFINYGEIGVQGTRHPDVLSLWLTMQHLGKQQMGRLVDQAMETAQAFYQRVCQRPWLTPATQPETGVVVFRATPSWVPAQGHDDLNVNLQARLLQEAGVFVALSRYADKNWLRGVVLNPYTGEEQLERLFSALDAFLEQSR